MKKLLVCSLFSLSLIAMDNSKEGQGLTIKWTPTASESTDFEKEKRDSLEELKKICNDLRYVELGDWIISDENLDPNLVKKYHYGWTPLIWAASKGYNKIVRLLIKAGANVNAKTNEGDSALMLAGAWGREKVVKTLLKNKAEIDVKAHDGLTPLMWAVHEGFSTIVKLLLRDDADQNIMNRNGQTALDIARDKENQEIINLFNKQNLHPC